MAKISEESEDLYYALKAKGFSPEFCQLIIQQLNTTWTAKRMLGYLRYLPAPSEEEIVDEMLAILSDRDRIRQKKEMEYYQSKINMMYMQGFDSKDDE